VDISRLNRAPEYWEALEKRLGFVVTDGQAMLIHCAGVSFENRQELLRRVGQLCNFDFSPPVHLEREPDNPYDVSAVKVLAGISKDDLTGEWTYTQVGFLPKKRCPECCRSLSGKQAKAMICPDCEASIGVMAFNKQICDVMTDDNSQELQVGIDTVTEPQHTQGNRGLDIWVRIKG
jgi:hypothetical protein